MRKDLTPIPSPKGDGRLLAKVNTPQKFALTRPSDTLSRGERGFRARRAFVKLSKGFTLAKKARVHVTPQA